MCLYATITYLLSCCVYQIEACMRSIANGLFAVFACLGVPPIIK